MRPILCALAALSALACGCSTTAVMNATCVLADHREIVLEGRECVICQKKNRTVIACQID